MGNTADIILGEEYDLPDEFKEVVSTYVDWEKLPKGHFLQQVEQGRKGMNVGWGNGLTRINTALHGTHRGRYYLIGADSGVGKTTIADFMYLLSLYEYAKQHGKKWYCYYYSLEMSKTEKVARWVSYFIHIKFGVVLPPNYILGRINGMLPSDEHMKLIRMGYAYVQDMGKHIQFTEEAIHPTGVFSSMIENHYKNHGTVEYGPVPPGKKRGPITGYVSKYPIEDEPMVTVVIDHLALIHSEQGMDTKQAMDLMSKYAVALRNLFNTTFVILQQFSTDMQTWHRSAKKITDKFISPQRLDFGDTKYTYRDADVVFGAVAPHMFDLETFFGYKVDEFSGYFLALYVMKNRYGSSSGMFPLFMHPLTGALEELPKPSDDFMLHTFIDKASEIEQLCQKFSPKQ